MPIDTNDAFESIKFQYRNENDPDFQLHYEFHHTEEYGPTITIHNLEIGSFSLPASAYADAVDFLRSRQAIPGGSPKSTSSGAARPGGRLTPTKVSSAFGGQTQPSQQPQYTEPASYASQASLFAQGQGAVESWATTKPQQKPQPKTPSQEHYERIEALKREAGQLDVTDLGETTAHNLDTLAQLPADPTDEGLDPEFTLQNASKVKQTAVKPARAVIKRRDE